MVMKSIQTTIIIAVIVVIGFYVFPKFGNNFSTNDYKSDADIKQIFVSQIKDLPDGDLTSLQCRNMYDKESESEIYAINSVRVKDYVYLNSKKICLALIERYVNFEGGFSDYGAIKDFGSNTILYEYEFNSSANYSQISSSTILLGKQLFPNKFETAKNVFNYTKDTLR